MFKSKHFIKSFIKMTHHHRFKKWFAYIVSILFMTGCQNLTTTPITSHPSALTISSPQQPPSLPLHTPILGASIEHPIPMSSVLASMNYLDQLVWEDNTPVQWERIHSVKRPTPLPPPTTFLEKTKGFFGLRKIPGPILDCYRLSGANHPDQELWINPYAGENYPLPPQGFYFR